MTDNTSSYMLIPWSAFRDTQLLSRMSFSPAQFIDIPGPRFVNKRRSDKLDEVDTLKLEMPKLEVTEVRDGIVVGGTDFTLSGETAIFPDAFVPSRDTCPAEVFGVASIDRHKALMRLYLTHQPKKVNFAAALLGQSATNYAHWLTEILPKLLVLDAFAEFDNAPLLLDHGLHPNILESVSILNTKHRNVIMVGRWEPVRVDRLLYISQPGYEPYIPHGLSAKGLTGIVNTFSSPALNILRDTASRVTGKSGQAGAKKLYIRRSKSSGNLRGIINSDVIEGLVRVKGFQVVEPSSLTFFEQVVACKQAEIIVAPIGAALANMIFSPAGCKVIALAPYYEEASYYYYSNLAGVLGHEFYYILGRQINKNGHPMHREYSIDPSELEMAITSLLSNRSPLYKPNVDRELRK
ncbi:glycosyltransferase family 61 protein [Nitrosovibrio tenuis]|uniref:Glycosyltransferase 61 catalytic domain-containing protein n=1 Tax=Nitrosovibrio tenuis TaxID=1233 RepID=A0A1H7GCG5_9PROT|nr:glycosyltransferase 61 family protein [Nitrosovibrio tenuis]SEK35811.1 Protein of unknown function [Nitrosovibrio tenuis]